MSTRLAVGKLARDTRTDKIGVYMGKAGPYAMLRPVSGGREWEVPPAKLEPLSDYEALSFNVRVANERSKRGRL